MGGTWGWESPITSAGTRCIHRLEYKYSKLVMNAAAKESELPAPDTCAIMEGEDAEDDLVFATKKSLFGKIKSLTSKVRGAEPQSIPRPCRGCPVLRFPAMVLMPITAEDAGWVRLGAAEDIVRWQRDGAVMGAGVPIPVPPPQNVALGTCFCPCVPPAKHQTVPNTGVGFV